jgi:hypothetical protein
MQGGEPRWPEWIGDVHAAEAAKEDSDSDDNVPAPNAQIPTTPSQSVSLIVLFGGTVKQSQGVTQVDE